MVYRRNYHFKEFGISVEGVIASAGVVGLAVGFGAQTIVKGSNYKVSLLYLKTSLM